MAVVRVEVMEVGVVAEVMIVKIEMTAVRGSALLGTTLITDHVTGTVCDGVIVMLEGGWWEGDGWGELGVVGMVKVTVEVVPVKAVAGYTEWHSSTQP